MEGHGRRPATGAEGRALRRATAAEDRAHRLGTAEEDLGLPKVVDVGIGQDLKTAVTDRARLAARDPYYQTPED